MEEKFIQKFTDGRQHLYTPDALCSAIKRTDDINKNYLTEEDRKKNSYSFNLVPSDLPGELFRSHPNEPRISASTFGRIRIDGDIAMQADIKPLAGYLYLQDYLSFKKAGVCLAEEWVYQVVANVWLEPPPADGDTWDIHHIDNDGYHNAANNLIWIRRSSHSEIHRRSFHA